MIYHFSLKAVGIVAGLFLILDGLVGFVMAEAVRNFATKLPRSRAAGLILLALALVWSFWLLATMEMGEFAAFRRFLLFALPIGAVLVARFVDEFLSVRALGILCLLVAEPLLEAAFLRYENSRLLVTVFAYLLIVAGLLWVTMPYLLRDQIGWLVRSPARWRIMHALLFLYGVAILICAMISY